MSHVETGAVRQVDGEWEEFVNGVWYHAGPWRKLTTKNVSFSRGVTTRTGTSVFAVSGPFQPKMPILLSPRFAFRSTSRTGHTMVVPAGNGASIR